MSEVRRESCGVEVQERPHPILRDLVITMPTRDQAINMFADLAKIFQGVEGAKIRSGYWTIYLSNGSRLKVRATSWDHD